MSPKSFTRSWRGAKVALVALALVAGCAPIGLRDRPPELVPVPPPRAGTDRSPLGALPKLPGNDPEVTTASASAPLGTGALAAETVARVGPDAITRRELDKAVAAFLEERVPEDQRDKVPPELLKQLEARCLAELVDRALVLQDCRRTLKNPKQWETLQDLALKKWRDEELPGALKKAGAGSESELARKLVDQGTSLAQVQDEYRDQSVFQEFLRMKIGRKLKLDLPELRAHYEAHRNEPAFRIEPSVTWREVAFDAAKSGGREEARRKAIVARERIVKGADFATLARAGHGATASEGGLWTTRPGGHALKEIEAQLQSLPIKTISPVIEGPDGFHLLLVESRVAEGTKTFAEAQDQVREALFRERLRDESAAYVEGLRAAAGASTIFDEGEAAPAKATP